MILKAQTERNSEPKKVSKAHNINLINKWYHFVGKNYFNN